MSEAVESDTHCPLGATVVASGVVFRVWAPDATALAVHIDGHEATPMLRGAGAIWSATVAGIGARARYRFQLDDRGAFPDPYSRSQPEGPHGASEVIDPLEYQWHDGTWRGIGASQLVIYELHVGTYTAPGTFDALIAQLDALAELGVTAIELMPIAEFPGARNWGYDGVNLFAPSRDYGGPDGLKRLVDAAHARGLAVLLDAVYNHFGPDGNYLLQYSRDYITNRYATPWGDAINYDGPNSEVVRRFVVDNARYWLQEYHIDGLRLDATFAIFDNSPRHILEEIATNARESVAPRGIVLIAETHENDNRCLRPTADGGFGFDAVWVDDFHHAVHTIATREHGSYYATYAATMTELAQTINNGWLFDGQHRSVSGYTRGTPSAGLAADAFIYCLQNHDQVGNRAFGERLSALIDEDEYRMWSALLLLLPYTPLLFMGQEFAASTPFQFFSDHKDELGRAVTEGRRKEFGTLAAIDPDRIPDPQSSQTFEASKLRLDERASPRGDQTLALYRELLRLRRDDPVLRARDRTRMRAQSAAGQGPDALLLIQSWDGDERRLLLLNHGDAVRMDPASAGVPGEIAARPWRLLLSTDDARFGGAGAKIQLDAGSIAMPSMTAALLAATSPT